MEDEAIDRMVAGVGPRRVVVVSDRYPPDVAGGAEVSLHVLLRQPVLREQVLVVTFDKALAGPARRAIDGVEVLAVPASAAWPLHRLSQHEVERLKTLPAAQRWTAYLREALDAAIRAPAANVPALAYRLFGGRVRGGLQMDHVTAPEDAAVDALRTILDAVRPSLVHADNARSILIAAAALTDRRDPMLAFVRDHRFTRADFDQAVVGPLPPASSVTGRLLASAAETALRFRRRSLDRAAVVVATSAYLAATLAEAVHPGRLRHEALEPVEISADDPHGPGDAFRILMVGSLTPKKGQAELLRVFPEILSSIPTVEIDIAGEGEQRAEIEAIAARYGAGRRIRLHGRLDEAALARLYEACDVVAVPTLWSEPFGRVPIEAGGAGKPVVVYASGGLAETVLDGVNGCAIPTGDVSAFVQALGDLAADPALRARMGEAGRDFARERFAPDRLADRLAAIWDETIASVSGTRAS